MRRSSIARLLLALLCEVCASNSRAAETTDFPLGVHLIPGILAPNRQPDGNSTLIAGSNGLIVVDTGRHREHTQRIIDWANKHGIRIAAVINTHWHLDHIGGNDLLKDFFPELTVIATDALTDARRGFLADYRRQLTQALADAAAHKTPSSQIDAWNAELKLIDGADRLQADRVIDHSTVLELAGRKLALHVERAVTAGDLWIEDRRTKTVIAGDLVTLPVPFFDTACPSEWRHALDRIEAARFDRLIPGHGAPMTHSQLAIYRQAFAELLDCAAGERPSKSCASEWLANVGALVGSNDLPYVESALDYYFKSMLRAPDSQRTRYCVAGAGE